MASTDETEIVLVACSEQSVVYHRRRDDGSAKCGATFYEPPEEVEESEALERGRRECLACRGDRAKVSRCPFCSSSERVDLREHLGECEAAQEATTP